MTETDESSYDFHMLFMVIEHFRPARTRVRLASPDRVACRTPQTSASLPGIAVRFVRGGAMRGRSIWAVVAGVLCITAVTTVVDTVMHAVGNTPPHGETLADSPGVRLFLGGSPEAA